MELRHCNGSLLLPSAVAAQLGCAGRVHLPLAPGSHCPVQTTHMVRPAGQGMRLRPWITLSSLGVGTYLGEETDAEDARVTSGVVLTVARGCNVIDTARNYRRVAVASLPTLRAMRKHSAK